MDLRVAANKCCFYINIFSGCFQLLLHWQMLIHFHKDSHQYRTICWACCITMLIYANMGHEEQYKYQLSKSFLETEP